MSGRPELELVDIDELSVGMVVRLDLSWTAHPFSTSRVRIASPADIETLRGLGLRQLHCERGTAQAPPLAGSDTTPASDEPAAAELSNVPDRRRKASSDDGGQQSEDDVLAECERQLLEAARETGEVMAFAGSDPPKAGERVVALTTRMVKGIADAEDVCLWVLDDLAAADDNAHAVNVCVLSLLMGRSFEWPATELLNLGIGALMHDLGNSTAVPERCPRLLRAAALISGGDDQDHVIRGVRLARQMGLPPEAVQVIHQHHEHANGSGYPCGLGSGEMTAAARVVALVNRYDHLCNPSDGSEAMSSHAALAYVFRYLSSRFDASIVAAFVKLVGVYPPGSLVELTDGRFARVMAIRTSRQGRPRVMVFDRRAGGGPGLLDLDDPGVLGIRRSVSWSDLPPQVREGLPSHPRLALYFEPRQIDKPR